MKRFLPFLALIVLCTSCSGHIRARMSYDVDIKSAIDSAAISDSE